MGELCKVNYPLYCCQCLNNGTFIVAGGGGAAKTGVRNSVEIMELLKKKKCIAESLDQLDTSPHAVMSMSAAPTDIDINAPSAASHHGTLALSMGNKCCIYSVLKTSAKASQCSGETGHPEGLTKRKKTPPATPNEEPSGVANYKFNLLFEINAVPGKEGLQTSVKLSGDGRLVASGGSDGHVRAWKLPSKEKVFDSRGHKDDVTNLDISPDRSRIVTISRDGRAYIWDASTGHKTAELHSMWNMNMVSRKYHFRNGRFGVVPDQPERLVLFTSHTPLKHDPKNKLYCCVTKWAVRQDEGAGKLSLAIVQHTGEEPISALTVSTDGTYLGIGFMEGSVAIYVAFDLQCVQRVPNLHSIFVTSLSFVRDSDRTRAVVGGCDAALVSVSADCSCRITKLGSRFLFPTWLVFLFCVVTMAAVGFYLHFISFL